MSGRWMVALYPRRWRERYGAEFAALVESQPMRPGLVLDILAGAIDARLSPQPQTAPARPASERGGHVMKLLTTRCATARNLSRAEQLRGAVLIVVASIGISLAYIGVNRLWGDNLYIEALGIGVFPIALMVATLPAYLRGHSLAARVTLTAAASVLAYLGALLAAWT